jgi:hypothetical protein
MSNDKPLQIGPPVPEPPPWVSDFVSNMMKEVPEFEKFHSASEMGKAAADEIIKLVKMIPGCDSEHQQSSSDSGLKTDIYATKKVASLPVSPVMPGGALK